MSENNNNIALTETSDVPNIESSPMQSVTSLLPILLIFMVFYFLLIRPQEKKRREQEKLISTVKKGEEVLTHSGIYGVVTRVTESSDVVEINIAKDVDIKILKSSIADIISRKTPTIPEKKEGVKEVQKKVTKKAKA